MEVTAEISTKNRYDTTLPLAIMSVINQSIKPKELLIFDDNDQPQDLRNNSVYAPIFALLNEKKIEWKCVFGEKRGQAFNHQKAIDIAKTDLIWRIDDDDFVESNVLETLLPHFKNDVGAIGSLIKIPGEMNIPIDACSSRIEDIYSKPNVQWSSFSGTKEVDHLNNSFLFRKSDKYRYSNNLSPVGHREETIFSHLIKRAGYKVLACGDCTTWHLKSPIGGIRSFDNGELWHHDETIFTGHMQEWGVFKLVVLNCGLGDHFIFKSILPKIKEKYKNLIIAVCYNDVMKDKDIKFISIADAYNMDKDIEKYNVYGFCIKNNWNKPLAEAFLKLYGV